MITVSLPTTEAREHVGELDGVHFVVWDGTGERPAEADAVEVFVGKYNAPAPPAEVLAGLPRLRVVQLLSAGVEPWLPVVPDGVLLCNGRGVHGGSTAELAVAGMLSARRELPAFAAAQARHEWENRDTEGITGHRVLVVGAGDIGQRIAAVARALDAEATLVGRTTRDGVHGFAELPDLLPEHEVVVIAVPSTPETAGLVDAAFLASMPDGALLVNIARGSIVDTDALLGELTARRLHAFLDVTDPEPLPADHPLWDAPNLVITPHVGGGTRGWQRRAYRLVRSQVERIRDGQEPENQVRNGY